MTPPRLMEQVRGEIRTRHYSRRTEDAYVHWIRRFIVFHGRRHPRDLGASEISAFVTWLAVERRVAASTQNQALSAVLFLYRNVLRQEVGAVELLPRARMPSKVPVVLTVAEVRKVLDALTGVPRIVAMLLYGAGLRLQECLELRVKDLDFEGREITVRRGKGQKDRRVGRRGRSSEWGATRFDIRSRPTCLKAARTSAPSRNFSVTPTSVRP